MPPSNHLHIGLVMNAWALYRAYPWRWLGASLLACGSCLGLWWVLIHFLRPPHEGMPWLSYLLSVLLWAILQGVSRCFQVGLCRMTLDQLNGDPVRLRRLFAPSAGLWTTLVTSLVTGVLIQVGYGTAYVPGLVLEGLFLLVNPILADRTLNLSATIKLSVKTLQPELVYAALFALSLSVLSGFSGGAFWPISLLMLVVLYPFVPQVQALLYRSYFSYKSFEYRG